MALLHYPDDAVELLHIHAEHLADPDESGIELGFTELKDYLLPIMDGDLCFVISRPGHGKSSILAHIARIASRLAITDTKNNYGPPIFISNEMPVEELQLRQLAFYSNIDSKTLRFGKQHNNWQQIHQDIDDMLDEYPIIYIGSSLYTRADARRLTIEYVTQTIEETVQKTGYRPRCVCLDYLQRTLTEQPFKDRRLALNEVVETCKDIALNYKIPVIVGSQASREVDLEKFPVPDTRHGKETGGIEEAGDWIISGMRPSKYYKVGDPIPHSDKNIIVTPDLYFLKVLKQRSGEAGKGCWISFDPRVNRFEDLQFQVGP